MTRSTLVGSICVSCIESTEQSLCGAGALNRLPLTRCDWRLFVDRPAASGAGAAAGRQQQTAMGLG